MYGNIEIVGFKSQFTMMYGDNSNEYFLEVEKGIGINENSKLEGIKKNNFIGTYLLGPILIENPLFTEKVLQAIGAKEDIALKEDTLAAYEARLKELKKLAWNITKTLHKYYNYITNNKKYWKINTDSIKYRYNTKRNVQWR